VRRTERDVVEIERRERREQFREECKQRGEKRKVVDIYLDSFDVIVIPYICGIGAAGDAHSGLCAMLPVGS